MFRLAELLIIMLPVVGVIVAGYKAFSAYQRRGAESAEPSRAGEPENSAIAAPVGRTAGNQAAQWGSIKRVLEEHS